MKGVADLSVAQRLAIGFTLFMIVVAGMLYLSLSWHAASSEAHEVYSGRIAPLRDRVHEVERRIFGVGIAMRSALLEPTAERVQRFSRSVSEAHTALETLRGSTMETDGRQLFVQIAADAEAYMEAAEELMRHGLEGTADLAEERRVSALRESVLGSIGTFVVLQDGKAQDALGKIAQLRSRISRGMVALAIATALALSFLAWLTARSISGPTQKLVRTVSALRDGDWRPALALAPTADEANQPAPRDEMRQIGHAFGAAAQALERREQRMRAEGLIAQAVASSLDHSSVAAAALKHVVEHVRAEVGIVYAASAGSRELVPIATHAVPKQLAPVEIGDGIPGQVAVERQPIFLTDIPPDSPFQIKIGYDQSPPKVVAAIPLLFGDALRGVLLVASLREFCEESRVFLKSAATQIGIGLQNAEAYEQIQRLLDEVREYNEHIQAQNEELQVQNEEIQAQNEEIQSQSEELQSQQEELQSQNEELMQQGDELRKYAAHLAEADERKNKFLGVLAHELRNPMAPIANSIHILKRSAPGSESALRAQAVIERQAQHLVRLIDDLLDVTRISEGKIHIKKEPIDLVDLSRVCVEDLAAAFEQANISLDLDLPNTPVKVLGDHTRLCQVLGNLLNNSIKFSNEGGRVQLSLRVDHASGAAVVRVSDDGIGMEADLLPRLFQPFTQGISGLARTKGGLGLGLSLVKALVGLHDGEVSAHSDGAGQGAEFTVRLPLASAKAELEREHATGPTGGDAVSAQIVRRLLIVEDNVDAARSLQEALRIEGYDVVVAHSGQQAFEVIKTFSPDVVLCDIGLPDMDGHEVARGLRANPATASSILIALTGYASPEDKQQAASAGFNLHLAKPLRIAGLQEILAGLKP